MLFSKWLVYNVTELSMGKVSIQNARQDDGFNIYILYIAKYKELMDSTFQPTFRNNYLSSFGVTSKNIQNYLKMLLKCPLITTYLYEPVFSSYFQSKQHIETGRMHTYENLAIFY